MKHRSTGHQAATNLGRRGETCNMNHGRVAHYFLVLEIDVIISYQLSVIQL